MPPVSPVIIETGPSSFSGAPGLIDEQDATKNKAQKTQNYIRVSPQKERAGRPALSEYTIFPNLERNVQSYRGAAATLGSERRIALTRVVVVCDRHRHARSDGVGKANACVLHLKAAVGVVIC